MDSLVNTRSWESPAWAALSAHATSTIAPLHLRDLLKDEARCAALVAEAEGITVDYTRQRVTQETMAQLTELAKAAKLGEKIQVRCRSLSHPLPFSSYFQVVTCP